MEVAETRKAVEPCLVPLVRPLWRTEALGLPTWPHHLGHAQGQALLQAAVLASGYARAVNGAVLLTGAGVGHVALLAPAEEALGKAGEDHGC